MSSLRSGSPRVVLALTVGLVSAGLYVLSLQVGHADAAPTPPPPTVVVPPPAPPAPPADAGQVAIPELTDPTPPAPPVKPAPPPTVVEDTLPVEDFGGY